MTSGDHNAERRCTSCSRSALDAVVNLECSFLVSGARRSAPLRDRQHDHRQEGVHLQRTQDIPPHLIGYCTTTAVAKSNA